MDEIWFFVVADDRERPLKYVSCEFMGMYAELMNTLCSEQFGHDWMSFTTFTQKDFVLELHEEAGVDVNDLPVMRQRFEPELGLEALLKIREFLLENEAEFIANEVIGEDDLYYFSSTSLSSRLVLLPCTCTKYIPGRSPSTSN